MILTLRDARLHVLLAERRADPFRGTLALPGGFLRDHDEAVEAAARRKLSQVPAGCRWTRLCMPPPAWSWRSTMGGSSLTASNAPGPSWNTPRSRPRSAPRPSQSPNFRRCTRRCGEFSSIPATSTAKSRARSYRQPDGPACGPRWRARMNERPPLSCSGRRGRGVPGVGRARLPGGDGRAQHPPGTLRPLCPRRPRGPGRRPPACAATPRRLRLCGPA
ncbi:NUDIX domain-containing protein [Nonomuraea sp. NPDC000554]|uniref:NUDIX domain-containing protein n=1 Tax=Nonomuraea sp. NPDC000554 TaxID=3154259 RepID=UPI0033204461